MCGISPWRLRLSAPPPPLSLLGQRHKQVNLNTLDYIYPLRRDCYPEQRESRLVGKLILQ